MTPYRYIAVTLVAILSYIIAVLVAAVLLRDSRKPRKFGRLHALNLCRLVPCLCMLVIGIFLSATAGSLKMDDFRVGPAFRMFVVGFVFNCVWLVIHSIRVHRTRKWLSEAKKQVEEQGTEKSSA
jgi:biotin transporter BioY